MMQFALIALASLTGGDTWKQEVEAVLAPLMSDEDPGGAVAVLLDGEPVWVSTYGLARVEDKTPVTEETQFYLASLAKPFTAAWVVQAAEAGKLDLEASVREFFPELPMAYGEATLRDCLMHRSGIPDIYDLVIGGDLDQEVISSNARAIELLTHMPELSFSAGEEFVYSNSGYVLLAEALERATDLSLAEYASQHAFKPLGMKQAAYLGESRINALPQSYSYIEGVWVPREAATGLRGPGGLVMSISDLVKWESAWRDGAWGTDKLRAKLVTAPPKPHHPVLGAYAYGWQLQRLGGLRVERHKGGAFGHSADLLRFPDEGLTVIALSNRADSNASAVSEAVAEAVLGSRFQEQPEPESVSLDKEAKSAFGFLWRDPKSSQPWVLLDRGDRFLLVSLRDYRVNLVAVSENRLEAVGAQAGFALTASEEGLLIERDGAAPTLLEALPYPPADLAPIEEYVGSWRNEALGEEIEFTNEGGRLRLGQEQPLVNLPPFNHMGRDFFLCDRGASLRFERDESGRVIRLTMDVNRAMGLVFAKVE